MSPSPVRKSAAPAPKRASKPTAAPLSKPASKPASKAPPKSAPKAPPKPAPAKAAEPADKAPKKFEGKKVRGTFVMPEADHALIAKLKQAARRNGLKVKKSELFRLGLRALDALGTPELRDRVLSLRAPPAKRNGK